MERFLIYIYKLGRRGGGGEGGRGGNRSYGDPLSAPEKGVINLQLCHKVVSREPVRGHKYVFDVVTSERVYHLNAESADEKDEWIKTLCRLLFGGEGTSHSSLAAAGGSATSLPLPPPPSQPSPPSSTELYLSNRYIYRSIPLGLAGVCKC